VSGLVVMMGEIESGGVMGGGPNSRDQRKPGHAILVPDGSWQRVADSEKGADKCSTISI
jgi:hypothetical protein